MKTKIIGNLEWQEEVPDRSFTWTEAKAYAESMGDGWRLPTFQELLTLVDHKKRPPCSVFPDCPCDWFWSSSSSFVNAPNTAWNVYLGVGNVLTPYATHSRVRLVREMRTP